MPNENLTILMGHLTRNPELRYTPSGTAVCDIGLAVNEYRSDAEDEVSFFDITFWAQKAEAVEEYFDKGDAIYVRGRLTQDRWQTDAGENRSKVKVTAWSFEVVGGEGQGGGDTSNAAQSENAPGSGADSEVGQPDEDAEDVPQDSIPF